MSESDPVLQPARTSEEMSRRIASTTVLFVLRRVVLVVASGVATILVARFLDPDGYGHLQSALATWALLLGLSDFGFSLALARDFAVRPDERGRLLRSAFWIQGVWSVVVALVMVGVASAAGFGSVRSDVLLILAPSVMANAVMAGRAYFTAVLDVRKTVVVDLAVNSVQVASMMTLAAIGAGPQGVAAAISVGSTVNALLVGWLAYREVDRCRSTREDRVALIRRATPLGIVAVLSKVYVSVDLVLLGVLGLATEAGLYAGASKMILLINTVPALILSAALPGLATSASDQASLARLLGRLAHWLVALVLPVFVFVGIFSAPVVSLVLGQEFEGTASLLSILALAGVLGLGSQLLGTLLLAAEVVRSMVWLTLAAVVFNVAGLLILVPTYGAHACAWMTVATEAVILCGNAERVWRRLRQPIPVRPSVRAFAALGLGAAISLLLPSSLMGMLIGVTAYVVALILLKGWPTDLLPPRFLRKARDGGESVGRVPNGR